MNEVVNNSIKLSKLEINTGFINGLPKKWLSFCQSLRNTNHVTDSELACLFGKLQYGEYLSDSVYDTEKKKTLTTTTPLSTAFISTSIVQDFEDSPDDEEDIRRCQEYLSDLEEEFHERSLLAKSKRFFKKGTQRFSGAKATDETQCHKCGRKGHFARAKLALLSFGTSSSKSLMVKNKGLVAEAYEWDTEDVCFDDNEMTKVKLLMALADDENVAVGKESARNGEWVKISMRKKRIMEVDQLTEDPSSSRQKDLVFVKSSADDTKVSIPGVERPWLSEAEGFNLPNHDTRRILPAESQVKITYPSVIVIGSSATGYDLADESLVCSTPFLHWRSLLVLNLCVTINEPTLALAKENKKVSSSKSNSAPAGKLKNVKTKDDIPFSIVMKYERTNHRTYDHAEYMSTMNMSQHLKGQGGSSSRSKTLRPSKLFQLCKHCGFNDHQYDDCFRRGKALKAKKAEASQSKKTESSNANRSKNPTKSRCSRHMTGVKSYLYKYAEQPGLNVVFGDDSTCITEGYGFIKCNGIVFKKVSFVNGLKYNLISISQLYDAKYIVQFDEKRGTIFNSNKEVVMIAPRIREVYVLDMTSSTQESRFFAKASERLNWLWHKGLAHLNFKTINQLAKQNLVIGLPLLFYSMYKPCSSCEKRKHHRSSFKTKQTSSIIKCLHLLHMDLFGHVTPRVENQDDIHVKQLRTDNGTEFRISILVNFFDEKRISQNFSSPYTPKQNGVGERKNRTLIEAVRAMLSGSGEINKHEYKSTYIITHIAISVVTVVMSADSAVTYTSVHSEAQSWSIPSEDPYEEADRHRCWRGTLLQSIVLIHGAGGSCNRYTFLEPEASED
ncbi:retrovirus-related pol polyprotein from transposon TNT 1-94 [Tanacetum coccineum]